MIQEMVRSWSCEVPMWVGAQVVEKIIVGERAVDDEDGRSPRSPRLPRPPGHGSAPRDPTVAIRGGHRRPSSPG